MMNVEKWRRDIYAHMLRTRGKKYRWFLRYLKLFRLISKTPARADFLETYYTLLRFVDDVVDQDAKLPAGYFSSEEYLMAKIRFAEFPRNPHDDVDHLLAYCYELGDSFGESFTEETKAILESFLFDARRIFRKIIYSEKELFAHYHQLDILGTIKATLKLFDEGAENYDLLEPLGMASRYFYDIRDFSEDISRGYVNVSAEDMRRFQISAADLENMEAPGVRTWFRVQSLRGLALLETHRRLLQQSKFRFSTRLAFRLVYENPARRYFNKVIKATDDLGAISLTDAGS